MSGCLVQTQRGAVRQDSVAASFGRRTSGSSTSHLPTKWMWPQGTSTGGQKEVRRLDEEARARGAAAVRIRGRGYWCRQQLSKASYETRTNGSSSLPEAAAGLRALRSTPRAARATRARCSLGGVDGSRTSQRARVPRALAEEI